MSIARIEGRLDAVAAQEAVSRSDGEVEISQRELQTRYIAATEKLQQACNFEHPALETTITNSGNDKVIVGKPSFVLEHIATGRDIYAEPTRKIVGTPRLATNDDAGGLKSGEVRYLTDFTQPKEEYLAVRVFSQPASRGYKKAHAYAMRRLAYVRRDILHEDKYVWKFVRGIILDAKPSPNINSRAYLEHLEQEIDKRGIKEEAWDEIIENIHQNAPEKVRRKFEQLNPMSRLSAAFRAKIVEFEADSNGKASRRYDNDSVVSWTAVPSRDLTVDRVEEIERAVKYVLGEEVVIEEKPVTDEPEENVRQAAPSMGQLLMESIITAKESNKMLAENNALIRRLLGNLGASGEVNKEDKD